MVVKQLFNEASQVGSGNSGWMTSEDGGQVMDW